MPARADQRWAQDPPTGAPHRSGRTPESCAGTRGIQMAITAAVAVAALAVTMITSADSDGRMPLAALPVVLGVAAVGIAAIVIAVRRWGAAVTEELLAGYTTSTLTAGAWWVPRRRTDRPRGWVHWDWTGIEVRRRDGSVREPRTPGVPAPGFYASPHEPGRLELWTGSQWTQRYLDPDER